MNWCRPPLGKMSWPVLYYLNKYKRRLFLPLPESRPCGSIPATLPATPPGGYHPQLQLLPAFELRLLGFQHLMKTANRSILLLGMWNRGLKRRSIRSLPPRMTWIINEGLRGLRRLFGDWSYPLSRTPWAPGCPGNNWYVSIQNTEKTMEIPTRGGRVRYNLAYKWKACWRVALQKNADLRSMPSWLVLGFFNTRGSCDWSRIQRKTWQILTIPKVSPPTTNHPFKNETGETHLWRWVSRLLPLFPHYSQAHRFLCSFMNTQPTLLF